MKQHTEDYKINAVRYYLKHQDLRETCKIFHCKYQSLSRWVKTYRREYTDNKRLQPLPKAAVKCETSPRFSTVENG